MFDPFWGMGRGCCRGGRFGMRPGFWGPPVMWRRSMFFNPIMPYRQWWW